MKSSPFTGSKTVSKLVRHQNCEDCGSSDGLAVYSDGHGWCFASCDDNKRYKKAKIVLDNGKEPLYNTYSNTLRYPESDQSVITTTVSIEDNPKNSVDKSLSVSIEDHSKSTISGTYSVSSPEISDFVRNSFKGTPTVLTTTTTKQHLSWRGVTVDTMKAYGVVTVVADNGVPSALVFPYGDDAVKVRLVSSKTFTSEGNMKDKNLFGIDKFSKGAAKAITITEGELDCLSVYQMMGSKYPTVSVRSASSAVKDCAEARDFLNSFEQIYICFDDDEPGRKAAMEVSRLFDVNKVYHVLMGAGCKDANDYLTKGRSQEFSKLWWNAKPYRPKGIVSDFKDIKEALERQSIQADATYPFPTLQEMTYGIRSQELVLITAMEKVGKTEILRAIEHHLLSTTDHNVGVIHLEESEKRSIEGLLSYELKVPVHLPDCQVSVEDKLTSYKNLVKREGRLNFYTHFGSDDPDVILDIIRYLVTVSKCKYIFLDHITMLVTGFEDDDERRKLDYLSTRFAMLTRELDFTLFLVSHVNDNGQTRGSRNISKVADLIIHLDRDTENVSPIERNQTAIMVKGNRFAASSGPGGKLWFDRETYTVSEISEASTADQAIVPF